jgi:hypothetical protein
VPVPVQSLLNELRTTEIGSARHQELIKALTANFDEFKDEGSWSGYGYSRRSKDNNSNNQGGSLSNGSASAANNATLNNDKFVGYTFKRKKVK